MFMPQLIKHFKIHYFFVAERAVANARWLWGLLYQHPRA